MNKLLIALLCTVLTACGYSSRGNEMVGQVKKVTQETPMFCSDFTAVDVSLGVMRGGVGSMSTQDSWLQVNDQTQADILKQAADTGQLIKMQYDSLRFSFCRPEFVLRKVELVK